LEKPQENSYQKILLSSKHLTFPIVNKVAFSQKSG
jgi:hypothetical protein